MFSACENNKQEQLVFHLVLTDEGKDMDGSLSKIRKFISDYGQTIEVYHLSSESLKDYVCTGVDHVSTTGFARMFLPDLLPESISRVLYLDGDLVVLKNLRSLYDYKLDEHSPLGAISDTYYYDSVKQNALSDDAKEYFNSGVLLIDLKKWRDELIRGKMVDCALEHLSTFKMLDQDVINCVLQNRITSLPIKFNTLISWYENAAYVLSLGERSIPNFLEEIEDPVVCHYIGSQKPWNDVSCPKRTEWLLFYSMSPWAKEPLGIGDSFEKSAFVLELRRYYWSDPELYVELISAVNRYFIASIKLKRKKTFLNFIETPIKFFAGLLERLYNYKSK